MIRKFKRMYRIISKLKHSTSKDEHKKAKQISKIKSKAESLNKRSRVFLLDLRELEADNLKPIEEIENYITHAERQIDQIRRRIILGETISHAEKVFSILRATRLT